MTLCWPYVCHQLQLWHQSTDFDETFFEHYAIEGHKNAILFKFLHLNSLKNIMEKQNFHMGSMEKCSFSLFGVKKKFRGLYTFFHTCLTRIVNELLDIIFGTRRSHKHTNMFCMIVLCTSTVTNVAMLRILEVIPDNIYLDKSVLKSLRRQ